MGVGRWASTIGDVAIIAGVAGRPPRGVHPQRWTQASCARTWDSVSFHAPLGWSNAKRFSHIGRNERVAHRCARGSDPSCDGVA